MGPEKRQGWERNRWHCDTRWSAPYAGPPTIEFGAGKTDTLESATSQSSAYPCGPRTAALSLTAAITQERT